MVEMKSKISRGMTKIEVPCNGKYVIFVHPGEGPDTYQNVFSRLIARGLRPATGDETASLLYTAYCELPNEPESKEIKEIMRKGWMWVANRNLWVPGKNGGVYVVYDEKGVGRGKELDIGELEKTLEGSEDINGTRLSRNGSVRFALRETYQEGIQKPEDFVKNGFVIANYGAEGAEKLKEVAKTFKSDLKVWIVSPDNKPELRVSALGGGVGGLHVGGGRGRAFGVLNSAEGNAKK